MYVQKCYYKSKKFLPTKGFELATFFTLSLHAIHCATNSLGKVVHNLSSKSIKSPLYFTSIK